MKAGDVVGHPTYGVGTVREMRKMGLEAYVAFHIGVMLHCPTHDLRLLGVSDEKRRTRNEENGRVTPAPHQVNVQAPTVPLSGSGEQPLVAPLPPAKTPSPSHPIATTPPAPPSQKTRPGRAPVHITYNERFQARQIIEALRLGVVPRFKIDEFTVGFHAERADIGRALVEADELGGDVRAIVGEYGAGKSHLFQWAAFEALRRGYLVASASLDIFETPPSKPNRIYNALIKSLQYPDRVESGSLAPLFDKFSDEAAFNRLSADMRGRRAVCPLRDAFVAYQRAKASGHRRHVGTILNWIAGERVHNLDIREAAGRTDVAQLRSFTTVADQYCYLLSAIGWMARQASYKGLVILVDESEHYSLLSSQMKQRADVFFQGMIYSALGDRQDRIEGCRNMRHRHCGLPHGGHNPYPFSYAPDAGLLFMFAATESAISLDYESWLDDEKVKHLDARLSPGEIEELFARIYVFHSRAYSYDRKEDFADVGMKLIGFYEAGLFNLRELIRYSTEVFDLLYAHPDYMYDSLAKEIDRAFA